MKSVMRAALLALVVVFGLIVPRLSPAMAEDFYAASPAELAGPPGSIIRIEPWPVEGIYRARILCILYRSLDPGGRPITVSGSVIIPDFAIPPGGRRIVAWAHPTTGVARHCAPTLTQTPFDSIAGLTDLVAAGLVVVATDYPGLGTSGVHPYLVGVSEGRAVLDSIRAVKAIPEARTSDQAAIWGHSQGGHAALWAGQLARAYAPEIQLRGVAVAAPATALGQLLDDDEDTSGGKVLLALALHSWSQLFGYSPANVVRREDIPIIDKAGRDCIDITASALNALQTVGELGNAYLIGDPAKIEPWSAAMARNSPGSSRIGVPIFIAQGNSDNVVDPPVTKAYARNLCRNGETVDYRELEGIDHGMAARKSSSRAVGWMLERFEGRTANGCQFR